MARHLLSITLFLAAFSAFSQVLAREDCQSAGLKRSNHTTVISGYELLKVEYDFRYKTATAGLTRNVLFLSHKFTNNIYFFSEMELEDAVKTLSKSDHANLIKFLESL